MKILVCVAHVPDTETKVKISSDGISIDQSGVNFMLNPYDEIAIEEGLKSREKFTGEVTAISVGGDSSKESLRKALAMGCDKAVLLKINSVCDSNGVAELISNFAKEYQPEIIFFGKQSIDYDSSIVGGAVAEKLNLASISVVVKLEIENLEVTAQREIEGGHEIVKTKLPAVIIAQKGLNTPRYPSLKGIMDAKRKPIEERIVDAPAKLVEVNLMKIPPAKPAGKIIGSDASAVPELIKLLHEEAKVI
ncbi:MAG: electron transfer flavoprotein subunit beta/FixA family protein [Bacteroidota bacterium]